MKRLLSFLSLGVVVLASCFSFAGSAEARSYNSSYHSDDYCYYNNCSSSNYNSRSRYRTGYDRRDSYYSYDYSRGGYEYQEGYRDGYSDGSYTGYNRGYYHGYNNYSYSPSSQRSYNNNYYKRASYYRSNYTDYCYDYYKHRYSPCRDVYVKYYPY